MFLFDHKIWRGDSGRLYRFKITLTRKGIPDYGGVYIFVRRRFVIFLKAIYVGNAFRTLEVIGWQHAEPVLRSLAYALLDRSGMVVQRIVATSRSVAQ